MEFWPFNPDGRSGDRFWYGEGEVSGRLMMKNISTGRKLHY